MSLVHPNFILYEDVDPTRHVKWFTCKNQQLSPAGFEDWKVVYDFYLERFALIQSQDDNYLQCLSINCEVKNENHTLTLSGHEVENFNILWN